MLDRVAAVTRSDRESIVSPTSSRPWMETLASAATDVRTARARLEAILEHIFTCEATQRNADLHQKASGSAPAFQTYDEDGNRITNRWCVD
jgi:chemotaxis regulatin CheY-phosphate phosphatase CheZ